MLYRLVAFLLGLHATVAYAEVSHIDDTITGDLKSGELSVTLNQISINSNLERYSSTIYVDIESGEFSSLRLIANRGSDDRATISEFSNQLARKSCESIVKSGLDRFELSLDKDSTSLREIAARGSDNEIINYFCDFMANRTSEITSQISVDEKAIIIKAGQVCQSLLNKPVPNRSTCELNQIEAELKPENEQKITKDTIREIQLLLTRLGYDPGPIDGVIGRKTTSALELIYDTNNLVFEGEIGSLTFSQLSDIYNKRSEGLTDLDDQIGRVNVVRNTKISFPYNSSDVYETVVWHGLSVFDYNNDGLNEIYMCGTNYPDFTDTDVVVIGLDAGKFESIASQVFRGDIPNSNDCTAIYFFDLNNDGYKDIVYSDSGMDAPPFAGTSIEIALNDGGGFSRISKLFEDQIFGSRSYALAVGDLDGDNFGEVILPDAQRHHYSQVIDFRDSGFKVIQNPIQTRGLWEYSTHASAFAVADLDGDGRDDLFSGGNWYVPSNIYFPRGLNAQRYKILPDTRFGNAQSGSTTGADMNSISIYDFDDDGDLDILNVFEGVFVSGDNVSYLDANIQILENNGSGNFIDFNLGGYDLLGRRYYMQPILYDLNNDGRMDIVQNFWNKGCNWETLSCYGSTFFINKGGLNFMIEDFGKQLGKNSLGDGMVFPLRKIQSGFEFALVQPFIGGFSNPNHFLQLSFGEYKEN